MERAMLDGNAIGGHPARGLRSRTDPRRIALRRLRGDRAARALRVHANAPGVVVRCPHCDAVLLRLACDRDRIWVDLRGLRYLELRRAD